MEKLNQRLKIRFFSLDANILKSRLFWAILLIKVVSSFLFAGPIFTQLFIPFLESFVAAPFSNIYEKFWSKGLDQNFPYPAIMLWIVSMPRLLVYWIGFHDLPGYVLSFIYRLPLIVSDLIILVVLCRWLRQKIGLLLWLYWASPVLFYINYMHGQLDVVAMAPAFVSSYFLFSNRWLLSSIFLAVAIAAKVHLVLMLPFTLIYLWQHDRSPKALISYALVVPALFVIINTPYILSESFQQLVLLNAQQKKVGYIILSSEVHGINFHIIPAIILILMFYASTIQIKNRDLFLFFMGSTFCVFLLFIPTAPGWYYWILPFLVYFYARLAPFVMLPLFALQVSYLAYFAVVPTSDFGTLWMGSLQDKDTGIINSWLQMKGINPTLVTDLTFTTLQTLLLINTCLMLYLGVHIQQRNKFRARPFMLGISGDSGAGKTTIAENIVALLGKIRVGLICGDDMHRWERGHIGWTQLTHLNPLSNELHSELEFIKKLRKNRSIYRRHYDHDTGKFTKEFEIKPRSVMILEGLHTFYLRPTREQFDLKVFVKLDPALLKHRKVLRDTEKRGHTKEKVFETIEARALDSVRFIEVQEQHADVTISTYPIEKIEKVDIGNPNLIVRERLHITLSNAFNARPIIFDLVTNMPDSVRHYYDSMDRQVIEIDRPPELELVCELGEKNIPGLEAFGIHHPPWSSGWNGIIQFFIVYCMFNDWEGLN